MFFTRSSGESRLNLRNGSEHAATGPQNEERAGGDLLDILNLSTPRSKPQGQFTALERAHYHASLVANYLQSGRIESLVAWAERDPYQVVCPKTGDFALARDLNLWAQFQNVLSPLRILCGGVARSEPENKSLVESAEEARKSLLRLALFARSLRGQFPDNVRPWLREIAPGLFVADRSFPPIKETWGSRAETTTWTDRARELSLKCRHDLVVFIKEAESSIDLAEQYMNWPPQISRSAP
ncbi:MAG: hypothetical protein J0M12_13675 [Deltaproteobacteria bacterium]|nr:hypothetical protein [Deltaproteobacteria bacterium]